MYVPQRFWNRAKSQVTKNSRKYLGLFEVMHKLLYKQCQIINLWIFLDIYSFFAIPLKNILILSIHQLLPCKIFVTYNGFFQDFFNIDTYNKVGSMISWKQSFERKDKAKQLSQKGRIPVTNLKT